RNTRTSVLMTARRDRKQGGSIVSIPKTTTLASGWAFEPWTKCEGPGATCHSTLADDVGSFSLCSLPAPSLQHRIERCLIASTAAAAFEQGALLNGKGHMVDVTLDLG